MHLIGNESVLLSYGMCAPASKGAVHKVSSKELGKSPDEERKRSFRSSLTVPSVDVHGTAMPCYARNRECHGGVMRYFELDP